MKCQKCGAEIPEDSLFCPECGTKIKPAKPAKSAKSAKSEQAASPVPPIQPDPHDPMEFDQAIEVCFKKYATFQGCATRAEFWWFYLFCVLVQGFGGIIDFFAFEAPIFRSIAALALLVPLISAGVRRMHDVGKSGWYYLIPVYNLVLALTPSKPLYNKYAEQN